MISMHERRQMAGLTQWELAQRAGVEYSLVVAMERQEYKPSQAIADKIDEVLRHAES